MSILVRGLEMPKCCRDCKLYERGQDGIYCKVTHSFEWDESKQFKPWKHKMKNCPLVEIKTPHGRLIDATGIDNATATKEDYPDGAILIPKGAILAAPTIIEAEE